MSVVGVGEPDVGSTGAWVVEVVPVSEGSVVLVVDDAVVWSVVVVELGFVGVVNVVEEDVVDDDAITPKSMSLRCSFSFR